MGVSDTQNLFCIELRVKAFIITFSALPFFKVRATRKNLKTIDGFACHCEHLMELAIYLKFEISTLSSLMTTTFGELAATYKDSKTFPTSSI